MRVILMLSGWRFGHSVWTEHQIQQEVAGEADARVDHAGSSSGAWPGGLRSGRREHFWPPTAGNRCAALFELAVKTGMRRGELLALRREDVDLDKGMLQVRGTLRRTRKGLTFGVPKTAASRRQVVLSPSLVAALWRHRARQEEERQGVGDLWLNLGSVVPNTLGRPMEPRDLLVNVYRPS
jgi:integrase